MLGKGLKQRIIDTYQYLHQHAEISWKETETTEYIKKILFENNCRITTFDDCTGVVGEYGNADNNLPVVAIRADIDALWQEVDGTFQANHSCGHDGHMSMVLGLLWALEQDPAMKDKLAIKFIFQPAEETGNGALKMVEKGVIDNVDYLFGVHLRPKQEMAMGRATPVIVHGATRSITAEIIGEDAHGARPHLNHNAIEIAAQINIMLGKIHLDPRIPHSMKMTSLHAGGKNTNIIPGSATFALDLRAQNNHLMEELEKKIFYIFESIRNLYNVEIKMINNSGVAAAKTNDEAIHIMSKAIKETLGEENIDAPLVTPGGDDFHFYTIKRPSLKATMLGLGCGLEPGLHHPNMAFNTDALMDGVNILLAAVKAVYHIQ